MSQGRSRRLCMWLRITAAFLLGLLLVQVLFDPVPLISDVVSVARIRWALPAAIERWQAHAPSGYQIHVKGMIPLACILDGELTVRDGQLVGVRMRQNALVPDTPLVDVDRSQWDQPACPFRDLTVERMFERVETGLERLGAFGAPLTVKFDGERGYITTYRFGRASRGGIFGYTMSDCCTWFEFDDLRVTAP